MKEIRDCKFVIVEWVDSASINDGGWIKPAYDKVPGCMACTTAGWMVKEDADSIGIASTLAGYDRDEVPEDFQFCHVMVIPKKAIVREYQAQDAAAALWPKEEAADAAYCPDCGETPLADRCDLRLISHCPCYKPAGGPE